MIKKMVSSHRHAIIAVIVVFAIGIGIGIFSSKFDFGDNSVTAKLVAVDDEGNGVSADLTANVRKGNGLVLVNINDLVADADTQVSARKAANVAAKITGVDLSKFDVVFNIRANAERISGASAGTPMTIAAIAAFTNKTIVNDVAITGVIDDEGRVNVVGSIVEKAIAAKSIGMKMILIPVGSRERGLERKRVEECGKYKELKFCKISYREVKISEGDLGIELKEIANIKEALEYMLR